MGFFTHFFHTTRSKSTVFIDISADSVAGAYVHYIEKELPVLLYMQRFPIEILERFDVRVWIARKRGFAKVHEVRAARRRFLNEAPHKKPVRPDVARDGKLASGDSQFLILRHPHHPNQRSSLGALHQHVRVPP